VFSFIFFLQTIFLGLGGITSLPLNSISMGFFGTLSVVLIQKMFMNTKNLSVKDDASVREVGRTIKTNVFIVLSTIAGILVSGIMLGLILGLQPWIAKNAMGQPLFFPYSWNVVLPSILIGNIPVIILESIVTIPLYHFLNKMET
jgi:cobalt/nickel transport system permease protein